ncbi:MAG: DEAD/DEAH box helicase [Agriterribacter sp.]
MTIEEIRDICIDSAEKYYNFLDQNDKGLQVVDVFEINKVPGDHPIYKLRLAAKLFDLDALFFKLYHNNTLYTTEQIKIIEYDGDKNILLVKPGETLINDFERLTARDVKVISDLKFLVTRIKDWYVRNGAKIRMPVNTSPQRTSSFDIQFINASEPSSNQKEALNTLFQNPFSYIWGAPGTGKTQFVLSYALLHYVRKGKKVAVLAPTNNALEQVLRGVIKMFEKASISKTKLLRLGTPSKKFAEDFPEVCEERGVMKKLEEVDKQIKIIERLLVYGHKKNGLKEAKENLGLLKKIPDLYKRVNQASAELKTSKENYVAIHAQVTMIDRDIAEITFEQDRLNRKFNSLGTKIVKVFSKNPTKTELALLDTKDKLKILFSKKTFLSLDLKEKEQVVNEDKENLKNTNFEATKFIKLIQEKFKLIKSLYEITSRLNLENSDEIEKELQITIDDEQKELQVDDGLAQDYEVHTTEELNNRLQKLQASRHKLSHASTEERMQNVNVLACTLDGYVGKFTEAKMGVDHIFMDEAGYSNIIKALTLFNHNVPITFLGDHMQLPPVCEINDLDIQRNDTYKNVFLWSQSAIFLEALFIKARDVMLSEYLNNASLTTNEMKRADLNQTYRFGENLAKILGRHVYNNGLGSLNKDGDTKLYYVQACKQEELKSRISMNEVIGVQRIVELLNKEKEDDFIILTPYKKQVKLLGQFLPHERNELKILTVHGSQGREWDTVILSIVDTSDKWFVDSRTPLSKGLNLLNTALSRAKRKLILVCDSHYWKSQNGQLVADLLSESQQLAVTL